MENVIDNPRGSIAVGIFSPIFPFYFSFFCIFAALFVTKLGRAEGGRQTYLKGVESTSYLWRSELRNF